MEIDTFEYIPSICKKMTDEAGNVIPPEFEGKIVLRSPDFDERMSLAEECGSDLIEVQKNPQSDKAIPVTRKIVKLSEAFYKSVDIKRISDGKKFESFKQLSKYSAFNLTLMEVGMRLMEGEELGNG